jgi:LuxR family maltose regulon positive regulatory protein
MPRVRRHRLNEQLRAASAARITLLVAGAGFGKSIALDEFVHSAHPHAVWFKLGREHHSLLDFTRGIAHALAAVLPDLRATLTEVQKQLYRAEKPADLLGSWLGEHLALSRELVIAIDGLQHAESSAVAGLVLAIERAKNVRWYIATRSEVGLPTASWLGYGDADLPLVEDDLRFTLEETRAAAEHFGGDWDDDELATLHAATSGWPIALAIALRRRIRPGGLAVLRSGTRELMYRYIAEQIFGALAPAQRDFALAATPLGGFDVALAVERGFDAAFVDELVRSLNFVQRVAPGAYRFDELFREFLEHQLRELPAAERLRIVTTAARSAEARGDDPLALALAIAGEAQDHINAMLARGGIALLARGHVDLILRALDAVSPDRRSAEPAWLGLRAMVDSAHGNFEQSDRRFESAIRLASDPVLRETLLQRHGIELVRRGIDCTLLLEPAARDPHIPPARRAPLLATLATSYAQQGRGDDARTAMGSALIAVDNLSDEAAARVYQQAAYVYQFSGDAERTRRYAEMAADLARAHGLFDIAARALSVQYYLLMQEQDDPAAARVLLDDILILGRRGAGKQAELYASIALAVLDAEAGNAEAIDAAELALAATSEMAQIAYAEGLLPAIALRAAWDGDFLRAYAVLEHSVAELTGSDRRALRWAELALYARAAAHPDDVVALRHAIAELARAPATPIALRARTFLALTELLGVHTDAAHRFLSESERAAGSVRAKALVAGVRTSYRHATGAGSAAEIDAAAERLRRVGSGGFALLLERLRGATDATGYARLTTAEREVLALLVEGASTKDVAARTGRSPQTVDTHVRSICRKLECSGRREAVALAVRFGWLTA